MTVRSQAQCVACNDDGLGGGDDEARLRRLEQ